MQFPKPIRLALVVLACSLVQAVNADDRLERACFAAVQDQVAWNQAGNASWQDKNIRRLCQGTTNPTATIACFEAEVADHNDWSRAIEACQNSPTVARSESACMAAVQGKVAWNQAGNTSWQDNNIRRLCQGTTNPTATIACFEAEVADHNDWSRAIEACENAGEASGRSAALASYDVREKRILEGAIWQKRNNVPNVGSCAKRCDAASGCRSFTYIPSQNVCELKRSAAFRSGSYSGYVSGVKAAPPATPTAELPSGVLELRHEAGYVADFHLNWIEPQTIAGTEVMMPKVWNSGNVTLGWSDVVVFPPGSQNITLTIEKFNFIAITEVFYKKTFKQPPNQCLKIWSTVINPKYGTCDESDFTAGLRRANRFFRDNAQAIELVSSHLEQRGDRIDAALAALGAERFDEAAGHIDVQGLMRKLKGGNSASTAPAIILASAQGERAVFRPTQNDASLNYVARGTFFDDLRAITLTASSNAAVLTGLSSGVGAAFATRSGAVRSVTGITSYTWQVCCGIGASAGLSLGFWKKDPLDLSGVGWGISMSLGYIGGVTTTGWADYDKGNSFGGSGEFVGMEISADFTTPSADAAYVRGWTCAFADTNKCTGLLGN